MAKLLGRIIMISILATLILGAFGYFYLKSTQTPSVKQAKYVVQSYYFDGKMKIPERYYYAEDVEIINGNVVLNAYWSYNGERYHKHNETKIITPPFDIVRRVQ